MGTTQFTNFVTLFRMCQLEWGTKQRPSDGEQLMTATFTPHATPTFCTYIQHIPASTYLNLSASESLLSGGGRAEYPRKSHFCVCDMNRTFVILVEQWPVETRRGISSPDKMSDISWYCLCCISLPSLSPSSRPDVWEIELSLFNFISIWDQFL